MVVTLSLGFLSFWCPGQWIMASLAGSQMASNSWKISCLFLIVLLREVSKPAVYISIHEHDVWQTHINCLYRYSLFFVLQPIWELAAEKLFLPFGQMCPWARLMLKWPASGLWPPFTPHTWLLEYSCYHPHRDPYLWRWKEHRSGQVTHLGWCPASPGSHGWFLRIVIW